MAQLAYRCPGRRGKLPRLNSDKVSTLLAGPSIQFTERKITSGPCINITPGGVAASCSCFFRLFTRRLDAFMRIVNFHQCKLPRTSNAGTINGQQA